MNRAPVTFKERALFVGRLAKPYLVPRAIDILGLEGLRRCPDEFRRALEIGFGQVDETLLVATIDAATLAGEAKALGAIRSQSRNPASS